MVERQSFKNTQKFKRIKSCGKKILLSHLESNYFHVLMVLYILIVKYFYKLLAFSSTSNT